MNNTSIRKILYRRPDNRKTVPAFVLCQNGQLSLIYVPCRFSIRPDFILLADDRDGDGIYEDAEDNWLGVSSTEMLEIGNNLQMLASKLK